MEKHIMDCYGSIGLRRRTGFHAVPAPGFTDWQHSPLPLCQDP